MKPVNKRDCDIQHNFACPHDVWQNGDEAKRISKKRNKRNRSKVIRKFYKEEIIKES